MKNNIIWKLVELDNKSQVKRPYKTCIKCNKEYTNNNIFASDYCNECSGQVKKEKTKERVKQYRKRKLNNT